MLLDRAFRCGESLVRPDVMIMLDAEPTVARARLLDRGGWRPNARFRLRICACFEMPIVNGSTLWIFSNKALLSTTDRSLDEVTALVLQQIDGTATDVVDRERRNRRDWRGASSALPARQRVQ